MSKQERAARKPKSGQKASPKRPDFLANLKRIYGNKILTVSGAELLAKERERF